jgi:hypothetical protein
VSQEFGPGFLGSLVLHSWGWWGRDCVLIWGLTGDEHAFTHSDHWSIYLLAAVDHMVTCVLKTASEQDSSASLPQHKHHHGNGITAQSPYSGDCMRVQTPGGQISEATFKSVCHRWRKCLNSNRNQKTMEWLA